MSNEGKKKMEKPWQFNIYKQKQYLKGADGSKIPARNWHYFLGMIFFLRFCNKLYRVINVWLLKKQANKPLSEQSPEQRQVRRAVPKQAPESQPLVCLLRLSSGKQHGSLLRSGRWKWWQLPQRTRHKRSQKLTNGWEGACGKEQGLPAPKGQAACNRIKIKGGKHSDLINNISSISSHHTKHTYFLWPIKLFSSF